MLILKRISTVISDYQEDENCEDTIEEKDKALARDCCLPDFQQLPIYAFSKKKLEDDNGGYPISLLNNLLLREWENRMNRGLFRYDVSSCQTKIIPGNYGYIAQLNEGRHLKKRPTEFRLDQVLQPFDNNKFNFTKIGLEEVLFRFEPNNGYFVDTATTAAACSPYLDTDNAVAGTSPSYANIVAINVSPIEYGHVLLIPRILDCLPQKIDTESLSLALYFAKEAADPFFRVGYNSLGAFATVNHLHFQAYYSSVAFPVEKASINRIMVKEGMKLIVSELLDYPVRGLVFEGGGSPENLSDAVAKACVSLQNHNMPFNLLVADCGRKVYLFPQCYAEKQALGEVSQEVLETQVNPAVWEISGHIVLKSSKDYDEASEERSWKLLSQVSLSMEKFQDFKTLIFEAADFIKLEN